VSIGTELNVPASRADGAQAVAADHLQLKGRLTVDAGAVLALRRESKSLLPVGCCRCRANSRAGTWCLRRADGQEVARGLPTTRAPKRVRSPASPASEIAATLGFIEEPELIQLDNLVVL